MIAGPSSFFRFRVVSCGRSVSRVVFPVAVIASLMLGVSCKSDSKPATKPTQAAPASSTGSMFQNMQNKPLPKPPTEEGDNAPPAGAGMPALAPGTSDSPECKALADEEKGIRAQVEQLNRDVVGPASERAEAAGDEFNACQDDAGCVGNLDAYKAKQNAYAAAKRAEDQSEKQLLELETRLHDLSNQMAAKCSDGL